MKFKPKLALSTLLADFRYIFANKIICIAYVELYSNPLDLRQIAHKGQLRVGQSSISSHGMALSSLLLKKYIF